MLTVSGCEFLNNENTTTTSWEQQNNTTKKTDSLSNEDIKNITIEEVSTENSSGNSIEQQELIKDVKILETEDSETNIEIKE